MDWHFLIVLLFVTWILQSVLSYYQILRFKKIIINIKTKYQDGFVGFGRSSGRLKSGAMVVVVADREGIVRDGYLMSGATVFARFKPYTAWSGRSVNEIIKEFSSSKKFHLSSVDRACAKALTQIYEKMREA